MDLGLRNSNLFVLNLGRFFVGYLKGLFFRRLRTFGLGLIVHLSVPILTWSQTWVKSRFHASFERIVHLTFWEYRHELFAFFVWRGCSNFFGLSWLTLPRLLFSSKIRNFRVDLFGDTCLGLAERVYIFPFYCTGWKSFHYVLDTAFLRKHYCFYLDFFVTLSFEYLGTSLSTLSACVYCWASYCECLGERGIYRLNFSIIFNNCICGTWSLGCVLSLKLAGSWFHSRWIAQLRCEVNFQSPTDGFHCSLNLLLEHESLFTIASKILWSGRFERLLWFLLSRRADLSWLSRTFFDTR